MGRATFDPAVIDKAARLDGVRTATALYEDLAIVNGDRTVVGAFSDQSVVAGMFSLTAAAGDITHRRRRTGHCGREHARDHNLTVGSPLDGPAGPAASRCSSP